MLLRNTIFNLNLWRMLPVRKHAIVYILIVTNFENYPCGTKTVIFQEEEGSAMDTDTLTPCVARTSAVMVYTHHYSDVIISATAYQITGVPIIYLAVWSGAH